ncbi:hypothetical protein [Rhizobium sp. SL42]|uniref:hypothetical protein n=1 Tax=Rhizobium sp. SL42 TaxID=2806346 RepID=UPI001F3D12C2|nr:hypothetical protein [Rhizobium sp. SL42]UJW77672.1 hypothetical protein IM739_22380 [Rhizobium sp. SL42]
MTGPLSIFLVLGSVIGLVRGYRKTDGDDVSVVFLAVLGAWTVAVFAPLMVEQNFPMMVAGQILNAAMVAGGFAFFRMRRGQKVLVEKNPVAATSTLLKALAVILAVTFSSAGIGSHVTVCGGKCRGINYLLGGDVVQNIWFFIVFLGGLSLFLTATVVPHIVRRARSGN